MRLVIKIGGSIATLKEQPYTPNTRLLRGYARLLARLLNRDVDVILVVGGGSFGHYEVARCREEGLDARLTVSKVASAMQALSLIISRLFESEGVAVLPYPPHSFCQPAGLKPNCEWSRIVDALEAGIVPLVYGDIVPRPGGYHIVSGDELAVEAACTVGDRIVVYATDVPGVIIGGEVAGKLGRDSLERLVGMVGGSQKTDVTGGMRRKLEALLRVGCEGLRAYILDGREPSIIEEVVLRGARYGTLIEL